MQNFNGNFDKLCTELQRSVLEELSLPDLMSFAKTRMENNEGVKEYMDEHHRALFNRFVDDVGAFINLVERTRSVILGSSTLHLFQAKSDALGLQDLDVCAMQEFEEAMMSHFKDIEEYELMNTVVRKTEYDSSAIMKIVKLAKGKKKIDVIITDWASATIPILQYHSTAVMNYMTAHTLISLYPTWTADKKSLVNPAIYMDDRTNLHTVNVLMKYAHPVFHINAEPFHLGTHKCRRNAYYPGTTRNTIDENTLHWEFSPMNMIGQTKIACDKMAVILWRLGGDDCEEGGDERNSTYIGVTA
ncbi:hypothetical protein DEU56DRAFT_760764 [Suillus clintonianus]|uniref:uncharacterized protein n=1 Tax=Suillus clintonianus TaxID=1904413 RepID=UPI001B85F3FF|nr:uncharacterized protein DEU56DRAFT_760764 [Suillus clintonianus]KAG2121283.1 hypothetical protein DEU56DRAFT_760764 [Suillus clintonianus]